MLRMLKTRPSPALVISLIALFVSLGGAGYAAVSVTGKDVKDGSLTGKDVKNSSLSGSDVKDGRLTGKDIKNGSIAGADLGADSLTGNQILEAQLGKVQTASKADNADNLDGKDSAEFASSNVEPYHEVGATGEPAFQGAWVNENPSNETTAAFYRDPFEVVRLKGIVATGTGNIFVLPEGYRPTKSNCIATNRNSAAAYICVDAASGQVFQGGGSATGGLLLDGITFRANTG